MPDSDAAFAAESGLPRILGLLTTFFFVSVIVVGLRMYTRIRILRTASSDDVLIGLAALAGWIMVLIQSKYGLGRHQSTISADDLKIYNKLFFCLNVVSIAIGTMFLKVSIALNLHRLCKNQWYKWSLRVLIVIVILYEFVGFLFFFLDCKPLAGYWDTTLDAKCAETSTLIAFGLVNTSFSIVTDVALAVLPIPIIWALNMKLKLRLYLIAVLSLGYLAVAMDIVKTYYQETFSLDVDETYTDNLILFGLLEEYFGMIAASVPMLRPLVGKAIGLSSADYYTYGRNTGDTSSMSARQAARVA
ncbi:integral membrane protein [Grosmannia clavigera kw1407]|uniref:Integral membrane protein n=1 Tax=Grosmannia clavigera (strain kw1407 / UAMH 11150) TaxID=655863 RepID=F0X897_GROCL|nr:uncharacterized protein CMQ_3321 [Grosmannia clavigera kw1407]EFX05252.1 integral membrane protein [Grosmannia clavigera kw1407]